jgi:glycosyltransferase involved in cell wall biosynthesis
VSPHKLDWIRQLQAQPEVEACSYVSDAHLRRERVELGWSVEEDPDLEMIIAPTPERIRAIFAEHPDAVHIFSGMRHAPSIVLGLKCAIESRARFGLCSEPRVLEGGAGKVRLLQSWLTERTLRRHAEFILAIGANGPRWFRLAGYPSSRIFPFGYFVDPMVMPAPAAGANAGRRPTIAYVGRLVSEKGCDAFMEAAGQLPEFDKLFAGKGPLEGEMVVAARHDPTIRFLGVVPREELAEVFASADILVLPSRTTADGWGVVVSEALMSGCFALVSRFAGASLAIVDASLGTTLTTVTADAIVQAARGTLQNGLLDTQHRLNRREWGERSLSAYAGARQFLAILDAGEQGTVAPQWPRF